MKTLLILLCYSNFKDVTEATCLISTASRSGSGVIYADDTDYYYLLSAGHVFDGMKAEESIYCYFYKDGRLKAVVKPQLLHNIFEEYDDLAVLAFLKKEVPYKIKPIPIIKLPSPDPYTTIMSFGYAHAKWGTGWIGKKVRENQKVITFFPSVEPGRSGSGIFTDDGEHLVGIVLRSSGLAISHQRISVLLTGWSKNDSG